MIADMTNVIAPTGSETDGFIQIAKKYAQSATAKIFFESGMTIAGMYFICSMNPEGSTGYTYFVPAAFEEPGLRLG